jgi:hypothetical protein
MILSFRQKPETPRRQKIPVFARMTSKTGPLSCRPQSNVLHMCKIIGLLYQGYRYD